MRFIENSLNSFLNYYGNLLFAILKSDLILAICIALILIIMLSYFIKKRIPLKKVVLLVLANLIFVVSFLVLPFKRGENIDNLKSTGIELISCINKIYHERGNYPKSLDEIQTQCSILKNEISISESFKYVYIDSEVINEKNKNDKGFKKLEKNSFRFYIESNVIKPDRMYYDQNLGMFVWTD